jgi:hypothetical protein
MIGNGLPLAAVSLYNLNPDKNMSDEAASKKKFVSGP